MSDWEKALDELDSLISGKPKSDGAKWAEAFDMMRIYLQRLSLDKRIEQLSVIHVAGTKGKGSTCAFVESMLRHCGYRTGLFTSPHLCDVRERIAIQGKPISKNLFLKHFWPVYQCLQRMADGDAGKPAYFRFLTLLALQVFLEEKVDVAILEVGLGGRLDATNCIPAPIVCGISSLGFDHMELLGNTLREIATEKAGIFKPGRPAFTSPQLPEAMTALQVKAEAIGVPLQQVTPLERFSDGAGAAVHSLGLAGQHQRLNAALAIALASTWEANSGLCVELLDGKAGSSASLSPGCSGRQERLHQLAKGRLPDSYLQGLQATHWAGRSQIIEDPHTKTAANGMTQHGPRLTFFIDGAHTPESMTSCGQWFSEAAAAPQAATHAQMHGSDVGEMQNVLLFHCMKARDPEALLGSLAEALAQRRVAMDHALFVPLQSSTASVHGTAAGQPVDLAWPAQLASAWHRHMAVQPAASQVDLPALSEVGALGPQASMRGAVQPSLASAVSWMRACVAQKPRLRMQVLVTGSLYLVGDLLRHLGRTPA